jgi:hypothetical protein
MKELDKTRMEWCESVASLAVDVLINCNLVEKDKFDEAVEIVAEEVWIRLIVNDYPPPFNMKLLENSESKK